ncbi:hypothetical protein H4F51_20685 [Pectobacterium brasiliense]|uniref:hypothetical protein n=1 Tax=Pectobacterium brasiliense TaxID=180957 RepID=UPI0015DF51D1|nr:hypothetical protein [Pectobacterium brasiliense]MBA0198692.1 hypothetical protein [Pectobacterium brasiliense]MBN3096018.1 hypothetical protein [Pectobacterium brasiliense]MBN3142318.1 hypothetical protein [Pectobacterium brasiliense]MBN3163198.1 hypothetical protein [Pectobacterium brasiliense]MBW5898383.1 hypothetical protein [Pectobacterium brasiliense]
MKYITCQNCYSSYESESVRCPDCNASQGKKDDGLIFFTDDARSEISQLGGVVYDIIPLSFERYIVPCEWGVIFFDNKNQLSWSYLCGIIYSVEVSEYVEVFHGNNKDYLSIEKGKLIKRETLR